MMARFGALVRHLKGHFHALAGRVWFRIGRASRARCHFERVLALRGDDFGAYIYLGRLAYCCGDYSAWRREHEHARRTCPERFSRLRHPFELIEPRTALTLLEEPCERATWRAVRLTQSVAGASRQARSEDATGRLAAQPPLGPISAAEIAATDLDDLARRLTGPR